MARSSRHQWLQRSAARPRHAARKLAATQPVGRTLRVESLEDRRLLASITVGTLNDVVNGNVSSISALVASDGGDGISLREAILAANANAAADTIDFAASLTSGGPAVIQLTNVGHVGEIVISGNVTINGPAANLLTVRAFDPTPDMKNGDGSRVFNIDDGITGNLLDVSISGLTLTGGDAAAVESGGALLARENLTLTGCAITGNTAGRRGGAIFSRDGSLNLSGSAVSGNSANFGGGGLYVRDGNLALVGTTISGNSASDVTSGGGGGGGILISSNSLVSPIVTITGSTVSGNSTGRDGGGLRLTSFTPSLTISNSTISNNSAGGDGGGMRLIGGTATIADSTMSGNSAAADGGAISASATLTITRSRLADNAAQSADRSVGRGGAIWTSTSGSLTIVESTISGNSASGHGGGLYHGNNVTLTNSTIENNTSEHNGGGIVSYRGNLTVVGSTITRNSAAADGGGIHSRTSFFGTTAVTGSTISYNSALVGGGINSSFTTIVVTDSVLHSNIAGVGGGIRQFNGSMTVANSTISGNSATGNSGALYLFTSASSEFTVRHSTIVSNTASGFAGGISVFGGTLNLDHTIVAQNSAALGRDLIPFLGAMIDARFNLVGDNADSGLVEAPVGSPDANGNLIGATALPIVPLLAPLASNGGPTMTHLLTVGSPAINAGDPSVADGVGAVPAFDQRGAPFVRIFGGRIDIGAFERQSLPAQSFLVDTLVDESDGDYSAGDFSLREAIELANGSVGADTITFAASLTSGGPAAILLVHGGLQISESLAVDGPGPNLLTIDASGNDPTPDLNNNDGSGVFSINDGLFFPNQVQVQHVSISGLTLTGGDGGSAIVTGENLTVTNCTISANSAFAGGGILVSGDINLLLNVNRSTIRDNSALGNIGGGGIAAFGAIITVTDSAITGNSSAVEGGGITNYRGNLTVTNSTISGNSATGLFSSGGGISTRSGGGSSPAAVTVINSTISGNSAGANGIGGGIRSSSGGGPSTVTVTSSIVAGNTGSAGAASDLAGTVNLAFSLLGIDTGASIVNNGGNLIGTAGTSIDPLLGPLADNGGLTKTHALLPGSPAIDAGNPGATPGASGVPQFDQRGAPFTRVHGGRIDMGAFESGATSANFDGDADVDGFDFLAWQRGFGTMAPNGLNSAGDADIDRDVDDADFALWKTAFGSTAAAASASPAQAAALTADNGSSALSPVNVDAALAYQQMFADATARRPYRPRLARAR